MTDENAIDGVWLGVVDFGAETGNRRMVLKRDGATLTGSVWGRDIQNGQIDGTHISFQTADISRTYTWTATLDGDTLNGQISYEGGSVNWSAQRHKN